MGTVLYNLCESLRFISVLLLPFMPRTPERIWSQLGIRSMGNLHVWESLQEWGQLKPGIKAQRMDDLFPRLDLEQELKYLLERENDKAVKEGKKERDTVEEKEEKKVDLISIDDFARVDIRVAEILSRRACTQDRQTAQAYFKHRGRGKAGLWRVLHFIILPRNLSEKRSSLYQFKTGKAARFALEGMILAATSPKEGCSNRC